MLDTGNLPRHPAVKKEALGLGVVAVVVFMYGIWYQPFINFETRFAVFAQEMLRNGPTLFPTTYGLPYPDYPVTSTLLIWLVSLPFGEVTKFSAVLPTALASAVVIAITYLLFAQYSKQWGLLAVGFELLTPTFVIASRSIAVDQMVSAITLAAFYLVHQSYRSQTPKPWKSLVLLLMAGFLIRGPIGLVIPAGVVLSHLILTEERKTALMFAFGSAVVLIFCTLIQLGSALLLYGKGFVLDIVKMQAFGRFGETASRARFYYFTSSFANYALSYPVAVVVAIGIVCNRIKSRFQSGWPTAHERETTFVTLLLAWCMIVLVGLSIPETKKIRYILPVVSPLAGLASYVFIAGEKKRFRWLRRLIGFVLGFFPLFAVIFIFAQKRKLSASAFDLDYCSAVLLIVFVIGIGCWFFSRKRALPAATPLFASGIVTLYFLQIAIVEPIDLRLHDTKPFVRHIESLRDKNPGKLVFYNENPDGLPIKYLVNMKTKDYPQFTKDLGTLKNERSSVWLLAKENNLDDLRAVGLSDPPIVYRENFGGSSFLAIFIPADFSFSEEVR